MFFFFFQLYNCLWVLACSVISFHCFLSCVLCFQLVIPIFLKSFLTSSSHLTLGLPFGLVAYGFHLYMVLATLSLVILSTCPNQLSRLYFMYLTFSLLIAFSNSSFVLSLHSTLALCVGPNILLNIFLSNTNNIQQKQVLNILNIVYTIRFSSSKCSLFHNSNVFGSCIIHILYTGCVKIKKKKFWRQKVNRWVSFNVTLARNNVAPWKWS